MKLVSKWGMAINKIQDPHNCFSWSFILKGKRIMLMRTALPPTSTLAWEIRYEKPFLIFWERCYIRRKNLKWNLLFCISFARRSEAIQPKEVSPFSWFWVWFWFSFGSVWVFLLFCVCVCFLLLLLFCFHFGFFCSYYIYFSSDCTVTIKILRGDKHTRWMGLLLWKHVREVYCLRKF